MDKIIVKINKLSIPTTILIASIILGGVYYASEANKLRYSERQQEIKLQEERKKEDQVKQEQEQAKQEQDKTKQALDTCLVTASSSYVTDWYGECKSEGKLTDKCISLHEMTFEEYAKQNNIPSAQDNPDKRNKAIDDFYKQRADCSCRLPQYNADRLNKTLQDDKAECFKKYPQN